MSLLTSGPGAVNASAVLLRVPLFVRYLAAGLGSVAADFSVYALLTAAGTDPLVAHVVSRPFGGLACFALNRTFTFRSTAAVGVDLARFAAVFGASLLVTEGLIAVFCKGFGLAAVPGKALAEGIAVVFNFLALKAFAFRQRLAS